MTQVSIANLPAFVGALAPGDLGVMVDVSDTTESPLGTTKRYAILPSIQNITGPVTINGSLTVVPGPLITRSIVYHDDSPTDRWLGGIGGAAGARDFIVFDIPNNATRLSVLAATGAVIVGTDPGGSELLRLGGSARFSGQLSVGPSDLAIVQLANSATHNVPLIGNHKGWLGTGSADDAVIAAFGSVTLYPGNTALPALSCVPGPQVVIAGDPGGSETLRVGGDVRAASFLPTALFSMNCGASPSTPIANNGVFDFPVGFGFGLIVVQETQATGAVAGFVCANAGSPAVKFADTNNLYSTVAGTAGKLNLFFSGGAWHLENKLGSAVTIRMSILRTG